MKIMFIVGSLVEKKNGVADYVLNLSKVLEKLGHQVAIISINDTKHITNNYKIISQESNPKIRLSNNLPVKHKIKLINQTAEQFNPDWISLQFVSFAYHKKGLPFSLIYLLKGIKKYKLHIMFHELWIDYKNSISFKNKILGKLQEVCIQMLLYKLKPQLITTSINTYLTKLQKNKAQLLPLFGNIKALKNEHIFTLRKEINVVFFGSFSPNIDDFLLQLNWIKEYSKSKMLPVKFKVIGNNGIHKDLAFSAIKNVLGQYALNLIGEKDENEVSEIFLNADIGISRANYEYFGKSGSTMAMLEHGLPVLLRGKEPLNDNFESPYFDYTKQLIYTSNSTSINLQKGNVNSNQILVASRLITLFNNNSLS
jgi:glycosyltransferase involved in cell wall biosynthesis